MTEGITGIPGTLAHRGTKLFGEHNAMAQEKQEQNRQFSLLFTVAKVVASVNIAFVIVKGVYGSERFLLRVFVRRSRNERTLMKKRNFPEVCDDEVPTVFQIHGEYISESKIVNYGSLAQLRSHKLNETDNS